MSYRRVLGCVVLLTVVAFAGSSALAAPQLNWDPGATIGTAVGGSGVWDTGSWWDGTNDLAWANGNDAIFGGSAGGTVTITSGTNSANNLIFNTPGYLITGDTLGLTGGTVTMNATSGTIASLLGGFSTGLTMAGSGALYLTNSSNAFTGGVKLSSGTLDFASGALNGTNNTLSFNGGTLQWASGNTQDVSSKISIPNSGQIAYLDTNGNANINLGTAITGSGGLTKLGAGGLTLSAVSTYSGTTTVSAGTLTFANGNSSAGILPDSAIIVAAGATLNINYQDATGFGNGFPLTIYGTIVKSDNQSETLYRPITLSGGTMTSTLVTSSTGSGAWDFWGNYIATAAGTTNYITGYGAFSLRTGYSCYFNLGANSTLNITVPVNNNSGGGQALTVKGTGTMVLSASNNYTAGTTLDGATLDIAGTSSLPPSGVVQIGASGLPSGLVFQTGSSTNLTNTGDGNFNIGYGSTVTIQPGAQITAAGDWKLGSNASSSSGTVNQNGGTLTITDSASGRPLTIGEFPSETSAYNLAGGVLNVPNSITYCPYNGTAVFNISGGTANLEEVSFGSGSGRTGTLNLSSSGALYMGAGGIVNPGGTANINFSGGTLGAYANWTSSVAMTLSGTARINPQGNTIGLSGALTGAGNLVMNGSGTLTLGASDNYSGGTTLAAGVLQVGNGAALGSGTLNLAGGQLSSSGATAYSLSNPLLLSGSGTLGDMVNNGALTFSAASGTLAANTQLTVNSPVTINGAVSGAYSLTKSGSGSLILIGGSTYSGTTTVTAGTLDLDGNTGSNGTLVNSPIVINSAGVLQLGAGDVTGYVANSKPLTISGTMIETAASSETLFRPITLSGGTITAGVGDYNSGTSGSYNLLGGTISTAAGSGTSYINLPGTQQFQLRTNGSLNPYFNLATGSTLVVNAVLGDYSGTTPPLYLSGNGTMVLTGSNVIADGTSIMGGTLSVAQIADSGWSNLGTAAGSANYLALDNGVLQYTGTGTASTARYLWINQGPGAFDISQPTGSLTLAPAGGSVTYSVTKTGPGTLTLNGSIGGSGTTTVTGGLLDLGGSNNYSGGTSITGGTLQLSNASALSTGAVTVNGGSVLDMHGYSNSSALGAINLINGSISSSVGSPTLTGTSYGVQSGSIGVSLGGATAALTQTGSGLVTLTAANTYGGGTTVSGGTLQLGDGALYSGAVTGNISNNSTLVFANPNVQQYTGAVNGTGNVRKTAAGTLTLSGNSTYSGATNVNSGVLLLTGSLASPSVTVASGATLSGRGDGVTTGLIAGTVTVNGGGAIDFTKNGLAAGATTTLLLNGLTLGDAVNPAGLTFNVNSSNAQTSDLINLGSGTLTVNPGGAVVNLNTTALAAGNYDLINYGALAGSGSIALNPSQVNVGLSTLSLVNTNNSLELNVAGNPTPTLAYWSGNFAAQDGGNANWGGFNSAGPVTNWSLDLAGLNDAGQIVGGVSDVVFASSSAVTPINTNLDAAFAVNSLTVTTTDAVSISGSQTLTINAAASGAGGMNYLAGTGIVMQPGAGALTIAATNVVPAASQSWSNNSSSLLTVSGNVTGAATLGNTTVLTLDGSGTGGGLLSGTIGDGVAGGNLALAVNSPNGPVTLSGSNTYSGGTTISAGTLSATANNALGTGTVTMNPTSGTAMLAFSSASPAIGSLANNGAGTSLLVLGNATAGTPTTLILGSNNASTTFSGLISDLSLANTAATGGLDKVGGGNLTLTANNSFTGGTTVNGGTLSLQGASGATPAGSGTLTINAAGTAIATPGYDNQLGLETNGSMTALNVVGGTFLAGNNEHVSSITMTGGSLGVAAGASQASGMDLRVLNSVNPTVTTLANSTAATISSKMTLDAPATFAIAHGTAATDLTVSGMIAGTGTLTKTGSGLMNLTGASTYTGNTYVNGGTLAASGPNNGAGTFGGSPNIIINAGGTLLNNGQDALGYTVGETVITINAGGAMSDAAGVRATIWNDLTMNGGTLTSVGAGDAAGNYSLNTQLVATSDAAGNPALVNCQGIQLQARNNGTGTVTFNVTRGSAAIGPDLLVGSTIIGASNTLAITGNGLTAFTGVNTYGYTTISSGTLQLGNGGTTGTSGTNSITNNSVLTLDYNGVVGYSLPAISGSGAIYQDSTNSSSQPYVVLSASDSYTGATVINGGFLRATADSGFGAVPATYTPAAITINGGVLQNSGTASSLTISANRGITLGPNGGYFRSGWTNGTNNTTINSVIAGAGSLTQVNDSSTLVLANSANTYTGVTTIGYNNASYSTGSVAYASVAYLTNGGLPSSIGESSNAAGNLVLGGGGAVLTDTGTGDTTDRLFTLGSNAAIDASGSGPLSFTNTGTIAFSGTGAYTLTLGGNGPGVNTFAPSLTNNGTSATGLSVNGSTNWQMQGSNSYSGVTSVSGGLLAFDGGPNTFSVAGNAFNVTGGTLKFMGNSTSNITTGTGDNRAFNVSGGGTVVVQDNAVVAAADTVSLGAANASAGNIVQTGGTLTISGSNATGNGRVLTIGEYPNETSTYTLSGGVLNATNGITYATWNGTAIFNISGGTANLNEIEDGNGAGYTGTVTLSNSGAVYLGTGGIVNSGGTLNMNLNGGVLGAYQNWSSSVAMNVGGAATIDSGTNSITLSGALTGNGSLTKVGAGLLTLSHSNNYGGGTIVQNGTLKVGNSAALGSGAVAANGGILDLAGYSVTVPSFSGAAGVVTNSGSALATLTVSQGIATTFSGQINDGTHAVALNMTGNGSLMLAGANNYSGGTTIANGTLQVGNPAALGSGPLVANAGLLDLAGCNASVAGLSGSAGTISNSGGAPATLTVNETANTTFNGQINDGAGQVALYKSGAATLTLNNANAYSGGTTIANGTLQLGNPAALGSGPLAANGGTLDMAANNATVSGLSGVAGTISNSLGNLVTLTVAQSNSTVFNGQISDGAGQLALSMSGNGMLTLGNTNTYSGATTVAGGVLSANLPGAFSPNSQVTIGGGTLDASAYSQTIPSLTITSGGLDLSTLNPLNCIGTVSFGGALDVTNSAAGTVLMTYGSDPYPNNTFASVYGLASGFTLSYGATDLAIVSAGPPSWTNISGGSWNIGSNWSSTPVPNGQGQTAIVNASAGTAVTITLDTPQTLGTLVLGDSTNGSTAFTLTPGVSGSGSLTMSNTGLSPASITVTGGTQTIAANVALAGSLTIAPTAGSTLVISGSVNEITSGTGVVALTDAGTLILSGSNNFSNTVVTNGTLVLTNNEALAVGSSLTIGDASAFAGGPSGAESDTGAISSGLNLPLAASPSITPVPEPGTLVLIAAGVFAGLATWRRRRNRGNGSAVRSAR